MKKVSLLLPGPTATEEEIEAFVRSNTVAWTCPVCEDEVSALGKIIPEDRRCYSCQTGRSKEVSREVRLQVAGLPRLFVETPFKDRGWPRDSRQPFYDVGGWRGRKDEPVTVGFLGPAKTGKTFLAVELLWRSRETPLRPGPSEPGDQPRRDPYFVRCDSMVACLFGDRGPESQRAMYNAVLTAPLLLLDDIGWGGQGRGFQKILEVLRGRLDQRLPVLWTSNLTMAELFEREGGAALMSRLEEGIVCGLTARDTW